MKFRHALFALAAFATAATNAAAQDQRSIAMISSGAAPVPDKPTTSFTGDLGFISASGNTNITTLSISDKIIHTSGYWMFTQFAAYVTGETNNHLTANQLLATGRADYAFMPRLSIFAGLAFERNTFAGFTSRTDEILGLSWKAIVAPWDSARLDLGGVLTQEKDVDSTSQSYPSARAAFSYKHSFSKLAYFHQFVEYLPNLQTSGSYRFNTETALVAPLSTHIGIKLSYAIRFDSRPQPTFGTTDRLLTTGIQISY